METLKEMVNALGPSDQLQWDIALYTLFFLNIVLLLLLPDGSTLGTLLSIVVLISVVIDKTYAFGYILKSSNPQYCHAKIFIGTYLIRAAMFVAPLTIAGSTRDDKVRAMGIVAGIGGAIYMFARWFLDQRDISSSQITCMNTDITIQSAGMILVLARLVLRHRLSLGTVHWDIPAAILGDLPTHEIEV
ncbi:MAG TPA: hypothetical protein VMT24_03730 [Aggregatilineaceae bacterium]|jgi:hypothetical protein|nr:hypothetical protein [Aggregatilineaceae bacterium]